MTKHTVVYNRTKYASLLACICPQILGAFPARFWRKYSKIPNPNALRLVWQARPGAPRLTSINPHFKEY